MARRVGEAPRAGGRRAARVVVPVLYLAISPRDPGGYNSNYAVELIAAHWVGVAAVVMILLALWHTVRAARR